MFSRPVYILWIGYPCPGAIPVEHKGGERTLPLSRCGAMGDTRVLQVGVGPGSSPGGGFMGGDSIHIVMRNVRDITPYEKNAKKHDKTQIGNVAESIKQYGFVQPVVIDRDGVIVIGHCRVLAAKQLKIAEVPCVCVDDLTPEQVNALRVVDNKSNESPWDFDLLSLELPELDLDGFDFDFGVGCGFTDEELESLMADEVDMRAKEVHRVVCDLNNEDETKIVEQLLRDNGYNPMVTNK